MAQEVRGAARQAERLWTSIDPSDSDEPALRRPEAALRLAALRWPATLFRAVHLELIPACRAAGFIGAAFRSLAPTSHPAIATLLAAVGLSDHGPEHNQNTRECQL